MSEDNKRTAGEELSIAMRSGLRKSGQRDAELNVSLGWLRSDEEEQSQRIEDFEFVNQRLNELMKNPDELFLQYRDIALLAQDLKGKAMPSLEAARKEFYASEKMAKIVGETIDKAVNQYPAWAKINPKYKSKATPAYGALIEGFGAFIGAYVLGLEDHLDERQRINRHYVLAFEEVLVNERPNSPLVGDVIGWMNDEIASFPQNLHSKILELSEKFKSKS